MDSLMTPIEKIDQAFLQLAYAIKLVNYVENEKFKKQDFDIDLTIKLPEYNLMYSADTFNSNDDIILATHNNYQITLGFTAITLDTCFESIGIKSNPKDITPNGQIRSLVYMIRCAFAHDMMHPRWCVKSNYKRKFEISIAEEIIVIDMTNLDGHLFNEKDVKGIETYFKIKDLVRKFFLKRQESC